MAQSPQPPEPRGTAMGTGSEQVTTELGWSHPLVTHPSPSASSPVLHPRGALWAPSSSAFSADLYPPPPLPPPHPHPPSPRPALPSGDTTALAMGRFRREQVPAAPNFFGRDRPPPKHRLPWARSRPWVAAGGRARPHRPLVAAAPGRTRATRGRAWGWGLGVLVLLPVPLADFGDKKHPRGVQSPLQTHPMGGGDGCCPPCPPPSPCGFFGTLATRERGAGLSFFFRGSRVALGQRSLSLSSSPFSSFFFLSFFTPGHFKRPHDGERRGWGAWRVPGQMAKPPHVPQLQGDWGWQGDPQAASFTLCRGRGLLCTPRLARLLHPQPPGLGFGCRLRCGLLPLLLHFLPSLMVLPR